MNRRAQPPQGPSQLPGLPGGIDYGTSFDDHFPTAAWGPPKTDIIALVQVGNEVDQRMETRSYGRALKAGERGIILAPLLKFGVRDYVPRPVHPIELRSSILFWDQVDVPFNNIFRTTLCPDLQFLRGEGLLRQTYLQVSGMHMPLMVLDDTAIAAFRAAERREPSKWSLGRDANSPHLSRRMLEEKSGLLFKIFDALPVPAKQVALADVLESRPRGSMSLKRCSIISKASTSIS